MKKSTLIGLGLGMLTIASCGNKKVEAPTQQKAAKAEVITDSAFQQKAAGDYSNPDGSTVIILGSDFTAKVKNYNKEYYKWSLMVKPEGDQANISLIRKGMDTDIEDQAVIDLAEGKIVVNNETFRKK